MARFTPYPSVRLAFVVFCICSGLLLCVVDQVHSQNIRDHNATSEITFDQESASCGPTNLQIVAGRLGCFLDLDVLKRELDLTSGGCSFWDLKKAAEDHGLQAEGFQLSFDELCMLDTPAILHIPPNHFCTADPRENTQDAKDGKRIRVYDPPHLARWMSRSDLAPVWDGATLVIRRSNKQKSEPRGPYLVFKEVFYDFGTIDAANKLARSFEIQNAGLEPLRILGLKQGCSCGTTRLTLANSTLSSGTLSPGETGKIDVTLDLSNIQGVYSEHVYVQTDDPVSPRVVLTLQGDVQRGLRLTPTALNFGKVVPGESAMRTLFISPGASQVRDIASVNTSFTSRTTPHRLLVSYEKWGREKLAERASGFYAKGNPKEREKGERELRPLTFMPEYVWVLTARLQTADSDLGRTINGTIDIVFNANGEIRYSIPFSAEIVNTLR